MKFSYYLIAFILIASAQAQEAVITEVRPPRPIIVHLTISSLKLFEIPSQKIAFIDSPYVAFSDKAVFGMETAPFQNSEKNGRYLCQEFGYQEMIKIEYRKGENTIFAPVLDDNLKLRDFKVLSHQDRFEAISRLKCRI